MVSPDAILLIALAVHIFVCLVLAVLTARKVLVAAPASVVMAFFVPVFGPVGVALLEARLRDKDAEGQEFDIEELRVNDAVHRSILMEQSTVGSGVVPLREAMLINDSATRRELIMDVLYEGAESQPHALREARGNDDAEVVHYATTALVELQKTFDERMAQARSACKASPEDARAASRLAEVLGDYIASGLLEGSMLDSVRAEYAQALENLLALLPPEGEAALDACSHGFDNALAQGDDRAMAAYAERACRTWPRREEGHLMALRLAAHKGSRAGVDEALAALHSDDVRLSVRGRHEMAFWEGVEAAGADTARLAPDCDAPEDGQVGADTARPAPDGGALEGGPAGADAEHPAPDCGAPEGGEAHA